MEARTMRAALVAAAVLVSMGARQQSPNFIIETPDPKLAAQISQAAEKYRHDLAVEWLGKTMPNWSQPCVMTVQVGPHLGAGGATTFVFDKGEVFGWRMSIQGPVERIFDSVLPHEITHMVFASHFRRPLPRWADEGGATSVEHQSERGKYRQMLAQFLRSGQGIAFNQMFAMKEYPPNVMPLYAEGYSLAEYLIQIGGRRKYVEFVGDGLESGDWSGAVKRYYGVADLGALQNTWLAWVRQGWPDIRPRDSHPAAAAPTVLASTPKRERPEPNLLVRDRERPAPPRRELVPVEFAAASSPKAKSATPLQLAAADPRPAAKALPASGWRAMGELPAVSATSSPTVIAPPAAPEPVRNQVTRPQPPQPPRQIILEWSK